MMSQVNFDTTQVQGWIQQFQCAINEVADRCLKNLSSKERSEADNLFKRWKRTRDKLKVRHYYMKEEWRAIYSQNVFKARIMTILCSFRKIGNCTPELKQYLYSVKTCVSIGCGPGQDIAAILIFLHTVGDHHPVTVLGVDHLGEWSDYVNKLTEVSLSGQHHEIEFRKMSVNGKTLDALDKADLCILSYTDAAGHSHDLWSQLKLKFDLVMILDKKQYCLALRKILLSNGYKILTYGCNGSKILFYWWKFENPSHCSHRYRSNPDFCNEDLPLAKKSRQEAQESLELV